MLYSSFSSIVRSNRKAKANSDNFVFDLSIGGSAYHKATALGYICRLYICIVRIRPYTLKVYSNENKPTNELTYDPPDLGPKEELHQKNHNNVFSTSVHF